MDAVEIRSAGDLLAIRRARVAAQRFDTGEDASDIRLRDAAQVLRYRQSNIMTSWCCDAMAPRHALCTPSRAVSRHSIATPAGAERRRLRRSGERFFDGLAGPDFGSHHDAATNCDNGTASIPSAR
jgi:hypothetical protein